MTTIMLANPYNLKRIQFPVIVSEKLDGVAADFYVPKKSNSGDVLVRSRQDEPILSVQHIQDWLGGKLPRGAHLICELYIPQTPFKDISGKVRSHDDQPDLVAYVYDFYMEGEEDTTYKARMKRFAQLMGKHLSPKNDWMVPVRIIPGNQAKNEVELEKNVAKISKTNPNAEGAVVRMLEGPDSLYRIGKRSHGMMKRKITATADLRVVAFEEATSEDGKPLGMIGRIHVAMDAGVISDEKNDFTDHVVIGAGPGKLTHAERRDIFNHPKKYIGRIAEISYMPDPSYKALREPRFLRWRDDKNTTNME